MTHCGCLTPITPRAQIGPLNISYHRPASPLLTAVLADPRHTARPLPAHAMVAVSVWMPTAGITRADAGPICATPDKISKALASGCQLFFPGATAEMFCWT